MQRGERNRFIRSTSSNVKSSRSHTIFQLIVESTRADGSGNLQKAKLNLCDLAGSEKMKKDEDIQGAHLQELKNINLSLTTLGTIAYFLSTFRKSYSCLIKHPKTAYSIQRV
jgi:Kinesin motor domain